jgi:hypothetical protein
MNIRSPEQGGDVERTDAIDRLFVRYLLRDLDEADRARLETEYLENDDTFEHLLSAEDDLIDAYARKELTADDRKRFEQIYLSSAQGTERVEFALALSRLTPERTRSRPVESRTQFPRSLLNAFSVATRSPVLVWGAAVAAVAVLAAGIWLTTEVKRLRRDLVNVEAAHAAAVLREEDLSKQIATERERGQRLVAERQRQTMGQPVNAPLVATLILTPGSVRGIQQTPLLSLEPETDLARLYVRITDDRSPQYRVRIRTVAGDDVWAQGRLTARSDGDGRYVIAFVPASALTRGDYILTVSGVSRNGTTEVVDEYYFRADRQRR